MHVFYLTRKSEEQEKEQDIAQKVKIRNTFELLLKEILEKLRITELEYKHEREVVVRIMAKFSIFVEQNGSALNEDAYEKYLHYLISR